MKQPQFFAAALLAAAFSAPCARAESAPGPSVPGPVLKPFALLGNPPPVQMLVPGFVVRQLPVELTNINNLAYSPDGRLFAYAYSGSVYQLVDTDGDGLEDKATVYYQGEQEVLGSVGMTWGPDGLYLASRKRIIKLRDNGDGTATGETAVTGWELSDRFTARSIDVYGVAFDRAGNLYFGLGISDIRNAYRVNPETGESTYSRTWDRGTIQKLAPNGRRSIYATGVRFTVALAFNAAGDLFATDQEGATWLPNGNPFDELLHIQESRHYGFPPRHPKYLPYVIDEPSVFNYGPQHVCTCGLHFNEPHVAGGPVFGPDWWRGDAIVAGQSRGKLYRTKLVKSPSGYVARNETIAHLSMLILDAAPSPQGDLVVTCHSGRPDNGTGPTGLGKLYKISHRDKTAPQPVFAYPASTTETHVAFDRPLNPQQAAHLATQAQIIMGEYVSGGDRFESFRPGYQAVKDQQKVPRYQLPIASTDLADDGRTLVLRTAPRAGATNYAIGLRDGAQPNRTHDASRHELRQHAAVDLHLDLSGAQARWLDASGVERWSGWVPHLDLTVARGFTEPSARHAKLFEQVKQRGTLELQAQLSLASMLRPAVQPGSKIDYEYPPESVRVRFAASGPLDLKVAKGAEARRSSDTEWELVVGPPQQDWVSVVLAVQTGDAEPRLDVSWTTAEDARPRALPLDRILMPWATKPEIASWVGVRAAVPELAGGDWERGRKLFFGAATCAVCHQVRGEGGTLGPDLSNLVHRDYASVVDDIRDPNATLNPDYLAVTLELKNGQTASGTLLQNFNQVYVLGQISGEKVTFPRADVNTVKPLGMSLMPPGLLDTLNESQRKDLLTFLLTEPADAAKK